MKAVITGKYADGKEFIKKIGHNKQKINLSNKNIKSIDLSNLALCTNIEVIDLSANQLEEIELTPIVNTELETVILSENSLKSIDLSPLAQCTNLEELILAGNELEEIDLSPLSQCTKLEELSLFVNKIK
ncbi:MAG: leucine-rich repeat protein, partial [Candidatus Heimdallarchaeaceae archaeon]